MSIATAMPCASAPLDQRLDVGDGKVMLSIARNRLCSPQARLCGQSLSYSFAEMPSQKGPADQIGTLPSIPAVTTTHSNPHSGVPPQAACNTARGFLLQGLSAAYRRPC